MNLNRSHNTERAQSISEEPTEAVMDTALNNALTLMNIDLILGDLPEEEQTEHVFKATRQFSTKNSPNS